MNDPRERFAILAYQSHAGGHTIKYVDIVGIHDGGCVWDITTIRRRHDGEVFEDNVVLHRDDVTAILRLMGLESIAEVIRSPVECGEMSGIKPWLSRI